MQRFASLLLLVLVSGETIACGSDDEAPAPETTGSPEADTSEETATADASATEAEVIDFCRERLANYKCPKSVEFRDELPKSGAGKILKRDLRAPYWGEGRQVG